MKISYKDMIKSQIIDDLSALDVTVLQLLAANQKEPVNGKIALQKEMFLIANYCEKIGEETDFESDCFGSYSEVVENTFNMLQQNQLLQTNGNKIALTSFGEEALLKSKNKILVEDDAVEDFKELLNDLSSDEICLILYSFKPEYTTESIIADKVFKNRIKNSISIYKKGKITLSKAAYLAGMNIEDFLKRMKGIC